jgi:phage-related protein
MAENEKITTKLEVDVTDFKAGLSDANRAIRLANSEFEKATAGVGKWSDSADGLKAKLTQLNKTLDAQETAASVLREEYERVVAEQGENSKGAQELAIKLNKQEAACKKTAAQIEHYEAELEDMGDAADDAGDDVEDLDDSLDEASDGFTVAKGAVAGFIANGLTALVGACKNAIGSIWGLAESTREFRDNMAKLETSFTQSGHSAEAATKTYTELYGVLGDDGKATEAALHLSQLAKSEEELSNWTEIATGIYATFGDSLPIEGLMEAANETAKTGALTGSLADALNWAGVSEEAFQERLDACNTEADRAYVINEQLTDLYYDQADAFVENNSAIIDANKAQAEYTKTQAELGAKIEPLTTKFTELKTKALQWLIDTGLPALQEAFNWLKDNLPIVATVIGGLTAAHAAHTVALVAEKAAQDGLTISQYLAKKAQDALNKSMLSNPISLIILAITALVSAFLYLWDNCEGFRNFWIGLWEGIKKAAKAVADWFVQAWTDVSNFFTSVWEGVQEMLSTVATWIYDNVIAPIADFFVGLWNGIVKAYHTVIDPWVEIFKRLASIIYDSVIKPIADFFVGLWNGISAGATAAWDWIVGVFTKAANWFNSTVIAPVKKVFTGMWDGIKNGARDVWNGIKNIFGNVAGWFKSIFSKAWQGVLSVFSAGGKVFKGIKEGILSVFKTVVNGLIRGINTVVSLPFKGLNGILDTLHGLSILGVSPFGWLTWRAPVPQIPLLAKGGVLEKGQVGLLEGDGAEAVVPLDQNKKWIRKVAQEFRRQVLTAGDGLAGAAAGVRGAAGGVTYNFYQYNTSPKALNRAEIYRQTKNQLRFATAKA